MEPVGISKPGKFENRPPGPTILLIELSQIMSRVAREAAPKQIAKRLYPSPAWLPLGFHSEDQK
jgi:hypothetical protein